MYGLMGRGSGCGECMGLHVDGFMFGIHRSSQLFVVVGACAWSCCLLVLGTLCQLFMGNL